MKRTITALTIAAAFSIPSVWAATMLQQGAANSANTDQWEQMAFSDACMNGEVPALGYYSARSADERS